MESFTEQVKNGLSRVLQELEPQVDFAKAEAELEALFEAIGYHGDTTKERAVTRLHAVLRAYREMLKDEHERLSEALFTLVAQLEYPSRQ